MTFSGQLAAASKNIKTAISRINYGWNLQNSPIFRLPDQLILRIFGDLQAIAYDSPSSSHTKWWRWLRVMYVCRKWWKISVEGSKLWENVHILPKMPNSFLDLILDRAGGRPLAVYLRTCDFPTRATPHRASFEHITTLASHRIMSFTTEITNPPWQRETQYFPRLFPTTPYPYLESLDISYGAFSCGRSLPPYRPDITGSDGRSTSSLIRSIPTAQLKHLTLRHIKGWPPTRFGNLTHLTLFGYADADALAEAVRENPALQRLRLESIKNKERYSCLPRSLVNLDGQTLELDRCEPGVLNMFTLSPRCSLVVVRTAGQYTLAHREGLLGFQWLPEDISKIGCLHELEELHFSITTTERRGGWVTAEQKTVGYPMLCSSSESGPKPHVTFILIYHYDAETSWDRGPFEPQHLLSRPIPLGKVARACFYGFHTQFEIYNRTILTNLTNLRSLKLRRCNPDFLLRFLIPGLWSLGFEDELSVTWFGGTLAHAPQIRTQSEPAGVWLGDLKIVTSGGPSSIINTEWMEKLKGFVNSVEVVIRTPSYSRVTNTSNV